MSPVAVRSQRPRRPWRVGVLAGITAASFAVMGMGGVATATPKAAGVTAAATPGVTVDPLQANCGIDAPGCGHVGESNAFYNGAHVNLLYTENFFCDANVASHAASGCEVGHPASGTPSGSSSGASGTSLGNTTHGDTLYIPIPIYHGTASVQCPPGTARIVCIDHPATVDLSALAGLLGAPATALYNVPVPAHNHVVATVNTNRPEWWNVEAVAAKTPAAYASMTSLAGINAAVTAGTAAEAPSNIFLFFQVQPGVESAAMAANSTITIPVDQGYSVAPPATSLNQNESGTTFNNLKVDCQGGGANCQNVGIAHAYVSGNPGHGVGQDVQLLYTENYFCGAPQGGPRALSSSGCEAGHPGAIPPGVGGNGIVPTAANSQLGATGNNQIDPLYIPVPLGFTPTYTQCPGVIHCIDHPPTIDLSGIAPYLPGHPAPSLLTNVPLPSHDHVLRTRNGDQPEWWNVEVVPVGSQAQLDAIENAKNLLTVNEQKAFSPTSNPGGAIDTNVYLWFQTLPGQAVHTPGAVQTNCSATLPAGTAVAGADLPDGTGYVETDSAGDVSVFGGAACYGSLTGVHLNKPIVGMAVDRNTGGYWLVASDGGIFQFNAPYEGSLGNIALNKPIVGMSTDINSKGYTLVAADGGIFTFNEPFEGSLGSTPLNKPIVGMAYDYSTGGYYLVASDGGVFDFGGARFWGSTGSVALNKPIVSISPLLNGTGYTLIAADGGTFQEGSAPFLGSLGNIRLNYPIVSTGTDFANDGFTDFAADGGVFTFNSAFYGSAA